VELTIHVACSYHVVVTTCRLCDKRGGIKLNNLDGRREFKLKLGTSLFKGTKRRITWMYTKETQRAQKLKGQLNLTGVTIRMTIGLCDRVATSPSTVAQWRHHLPSVTAGPVDADDIHTKNRITKELS